MDIKKMVKINEIFQELQLALVSGSLVYSWATKQGETANTKGNSESQV